MVMTEKAHSVNYLLVSGCYNKLSYRSRAVYYSGSMLTEKFVLVYGIM